MLLGDGATRFRHALVLSAFMLSLTPFSVLQELGMQSHNTENNHIAIGNTQLTRS